MSRKSQVEWFAVAFALTAGCGATNEATDKPGKDVDASVDASSSSNDSDAAVDSGSGDDPYVLHVPDGGSTVIDDQEPTCGASSFAAQEIEVTTEVEVPMEVTEEVTEDVTEDVTEEVTEQVTEEITTVKPTSLYIMFDQSASMGGLTGNGNLWNPAVTGLKTFLNDPDSAGLGVGIQYFPLGSGGSCSGTGGNYAKPEILPASLPGNASTIITSLGKHSPSGIGTPIQGALLGVTSYCKTFQAAHPSEQCIAVLVTDGTPELASGCSENFDTLAAIAKSAKDAGVITFAVGLKGANFTLLDKIAQQGGAPDCDTTKSTYACDISGDSSKLNDALQKIRQTVVTTETHTVTHPVTRTVTHPVTHTETHTVTHTEYHTETQKSTVPCEWNIPSSKEGFDKDKVNILWSVKDDHTTLLRVDSKDACRDNAWYFDDPSAPTRLIACEQTCSEITASDDSNIDILLGCATIVPG